MFNIPVVLFIFKRMKAIDIISRISEIQPCKLYIIADGPRNEIEADEVNTCRKAVENSIAWDCEVIKNYASENRGVYQNIGEGAKWVFQREKTAIFLEDDNLPEITFFKYCEDLLEKYYDEKQVLWICGTNYLEAYDTVEKYDYLFTKHMLPCGWASWSHKFLKYYDGYLETVEGTRIDELKNQYIPRALFYTMKSCWMGEYTRIKHGTKASSWDYQMDYSIKKYDLFGICPTKNQIRNIGIDDFSTHGGNSKKIVMTERFCEKKTYPLRFPLVGPDTIGIEPDFERKIGKVILPPLRNRITSYFLKIVRKVFAIPYNQTTKSYFGNLLKK